MALSRTFRKEAEANSVEKEIQKIREKLGHYTVEKQPRYWLRTEDPLLEEVFGKPGQGIAYGKLYEIFGKESGGKTAIALHLAALAQKDGAEVVWGDFECCWDDDWSTIRGLDPSRVAVFRPEIISDKKGKESRLMSAEETFAEAEMWVRQKMVKNPKVKIFFGIDSTPAIMPAEEEEKGTEGHGMAMQARFMTRLLKRWVPIAWTHNVMMVTINQIRLNPGVRFGSPEYTPGGTALKFYCSVRVKVKRARGGGWITARGKKIGIKGILTNIKNKAGGQEGDIVGYKMYFDRAAKFLPAGDIEE